MGQIITPYSPTTIGPGRVSLANPFCKPPLNSSLDRNNPLANGLVAYWPFLENSGGLTYDLSGSGKTGTITGATWVPGKFGSCLSFNGSGYVNYGAATSLELTTMTLSAWIKTNFTGNYQVIINKQVSSTNRNYWFAIHSTTNVLLFYFYVGETNKTINGSTVVADGNWHHVVAVYDGSLRYLYVDGKSDATPTSPGGNPNVGTSNVYIGAEAGITRFFNGLLDNVMIFNRALSAAEIAQLYREPFGFIQKSPLELWTYTPTVGGTVPIVGSTSGTSTVAGSLTISRSVIGTIAGQSTVVGITTVNRLTVGTTNIQSTLVGTTLVSRKIIGNISGTLSITGNLVTIKYWARIVVVDNNDNIQTNVAFGVNDVNGITGTFVDNNGNTIQVIGGIITNLTV